MLPEDIIKYILSFAPDFHENYKKCHKELLENKPIYYSTFVKACFNYKYEMPIWLGKYNQVITKYINGMGRKIICAHSIEISPEIDCKDGIKVDPTIIPLNLRYITINYGWGREKDHAWDAILRGEAGRKNLTTGYY